MEIKKLVYLFIFFCFLSIEYFTQAQELSQKLYPYRLGLNMIFQEQAAIDQYLQLLSQSGTGGIRQLATGDLTWQQIEPQDNQWNFARSDSAIIHGNKLKIYSCPTLFGCQAEGDRVGLQVPWKACSEKKKCRWNIERDSLDTKDYIQTVVKRYSSYTHYFELSNEVLNKSVPNSLPMDELAEFMQMNYLWIKQVDSHAVVVFPGLLGIYGYPFKKQLEFFQAFLRKGGRKTFDIMNYHDYNSWWTLPNHYNQVRKLLNDNQLSYIPIWVTETGISSEQTSISPEYSSEDAQAADIWRRITLLWGKGAELVNWHTFRSSEEPKNNWRNFGILDKHSGRKKSFFAFQLLAQEIGSFVKATILSSGKSTDDNQSGGNGIWVIQFTMPDSSFKWVLWSPDHQTYSLKVFPFENIVKKITIPKEISADANSAIFDTALVSASSGSVLLQLTEIPILVKGSCLHHEEKITEENQTRTILYSNYPNPCRDKTIICFELKKRESVNIVLFDILGQELETIFNGELDSGPHKMILNAGKYPIGYYFYQMKTDDFSQQRRMIIIK